MEKLTHRRFTGLLASAALCGVMASPATFAADAPVAAANSAKPAAKAPNPRTGMTGHWDRYPQIDQKPIAGFPVPAQIPPPPLKPQYQAEYDAHRKLLADAEKAGKPLYSDYTNCMPDGRKFLNGGPAGKPNIE